MLVELNNNVCVGKLYGHPKYPPGSTYQTKRVIHIDVNNNLLMDETDNFTILDPNPLWFEENKKRLQEYIK